MFVGSPTSDAPEHGGLDRASGLNRAVPAGVVQPSKESRPGAAAGPEGLGARRGRAAAAYRRIGRLVALTDAACMVAAGLLAHLLRFGMPAPDPRFVLVIALGALILPAVFGAFRLYAVEQLGPAEQFQRVVAAVGLTVTAIGWGAFWSKLPLSRLWLAIVWALSTLLILATRGLWQGRMRALRERGALSYRTVIVGANAEARRLADILGSGGAGFEVIGCVSTRGREGAADGLQALGRVDDLPRVIRRTGADCVFVASTAVNLEEMWAVSRVARREHVELRMSANLPGVAAARLSLRPLGDVLTLALQPLRLTRRQIAAKRAFDLVGAGVLLVFILPVWAAVAVAIRLTSGGRVMYRQERVGRDGRPFQMLKFRTMHEEADALVERLRAVNGSSHPLFKMPDDPRVTAVGRLLRRWSLDEVPQLLNVLRGEMSLVGPRPPLPREVAAYEERHRDRLEMTPGITGLWQVSGRSDLNFEESVRLDVYYVQNWSVLLDLYILARTLPAVLGGRGAY